MHTIGFIGLGNMGGPVARAIAARGYAMRVYDVCPETLQGFSSVAAIASSAVDALNGSDILFLSLPSTKVVEPIVRALLKADIQGKIIVDTSTSYPLSTRALYEEVKEAGGRFADVPLSGVPQQAVEGKLLALFGGDDDVYETLKPVVSSFAGRFAKLGGPGSGHITKLIFNFIALSYVNIYATAFPLTEKMGLDNQQLYELLKGTGMGCGTMDFYVPKMIGKTYDMAFALGLAHKDLSYVKGMFEEYQVPPFALDGVLELLRIGIRDGLAQEDYSACIKTMYGFFEGK